MNVNIPIGAPATTTQRMDGELLVEDGIPVVRERVQPRLATNPVCEVRTATDLAAGVSADLDTSAVADTMEGRLLRVDLTSSLPCKWEVKTRAGAGEITVAVLMTSGFGGGRPSITWRAEDVRMATMVGNAVDVNFRVTATNLDRLWAADAVASFQWDEVEVNP